MTGIMSNRRTSAVRRKINAACAASGLRLNHVGMLVISSFFGGMIIAWFIKYFPATSSDTAYWSQVITGAGAIIGAFLVGNSQVRIARLNHEEEKQIAREVLEAKRVAARTVVDAAYAEVKHVSKAIGKSYINAREFRKQFRQRTFTELTAALGRIPIFELDDAKAVAGIIGLQSLMLKMLDELMTVSTVFAGYGESPPENHDQGDLWSCITACGHSAITVRIRFPLDSDLKNPEVPLERPI
jgi:hypothetical protein